MNVLCEEHGCWLLTENNDNLLLEGNEGMAVTDGHALRFCNNMIRPVSDLLAQAYYACDAARDRWDSLGGGQVAIDQMENQIREACNKLIELYELAFRVEKTWFLGLNSTIPNDSLEAIYDNGLGTGQDPSRPAISGQNVHALIERVVQIQNWLLSNNDPPAFNDSDRNSAAAYNTVINASKWGPLTMSIATAGNAMTRFSELRSDYDANSNTNLGTILAVAVNPNR